jgi:hypothetical protein
MPEYTLRRGRATDVAHAHKKHAYFLFYFNHLNPFPSASYRPLFDAVSI